MEAQKVLITGGTGKLGKPLVEALSTRGYRIRVATPDQPRLLPGVEWVPTNFVEDCDYDALVSGCDAILHLGAELKDVAVMEAVNGNATEALVKATERAGVGFFLYTSSVCVYGTPKQRFLDEDSPLISLDRDDNLDYLTVPSLREYGRTKLLGEVKLREHAARTAYVVLRPTNISDEKDILFLLEWSFWQRLWRAYRVTHQVMIADVVEAILFALNRGLKEHLPGPGAVESFIISNDDLEENTYVQFLREAERILQRRLAPPIVVPEYLDELKDKIKFKKWSIGFPSGMLRYSPSKLLAAGFRHPIGVRKGWADVLGTYALRQKHERN